MPATLRSLIRAPRFGLHPTHRLPDEALDRPIPWIHSSDLTDPTPWLEPGQLLLTNGAQFPDNLSADTARNYVARLVASGVGSLAFATDVVHATVPAVLIDACTSGGLPLLEVTDRTPFISIIRHVADAIAADQRARLEWSMSAQRALARAALKPDGLEMVLLELQQRLDCWVALFDAAGAEVAVRGVFPIPAAIKEDVERSVRTALARGHRAGMRLSAEEGDVTLQTIGQPDQLRGVLAVGTATPLDPAGSDLVASVIGLASISIEQSRALDSARDELRSGLLEMLLAGVTDPARSSLSRLGDPWPSEPLRVATFEVSASGAILREDLTRRSRSRQASWFVASRGLEVITVLCAEEENILSEVVRQHGARVGLSGTGRWRELHRLLDEARRAASRPGHSPVSKFESMFGQGMLGLLDDRGGVEVAHRLLQPLADHPDRETLLSTLETWLRHGCAWDPAARELGIHRHTLRNRAATVERALGMDLSTFADRAELWLALELSGR